jgi:hypothetical protein
MFALSMKELGKPLQFWRNPVKRGLSSLVILAGLGMLVLAGCAKRDQVAPQPTPTPENGGLVVEQVATPTPVVVPTAVPTPARLHYIVKPGDTLWGIASKDAVLGDNFRWPLLFKENRDQILDPDMIEPAWDLGYQQSYPQAVVDDAVQKAKDTPPYEPRTSPRKQLPVKY